MVSIIKHSGIFFSDIVAVLALSVFASFECPSPDENRIKISAVNPQENNPPVVKITTPKNKSQYEGDAIYYSITVSDKEDGESKYDEIPANEIFLAVKHVQDATQIDDELKQMNENNATGLASIRTSNCMNCHAFNGKLIGPSFLDISKRYSPSAGNVTLLKKSIREGSAGVWGKTSMPTHPELTDKEIQDMVHWILEKSAQSNLSYYTGTEGYIRIKVSPGSKGAFVLSASYIDHGLKDKSQKLSGQDVVIIYGK